MDRKTECTATAWKCDYSVFFSHRRLGCRGRILSGLCSGMSQTKSLRSQKCFFFFPPALPFIHIEPAQLLPSGKSRQQRVRFFCFSSVARLQSRVRNLEPGLRVFQEEFLESGGVNHMCPPLTTPTRLPPLLLPPHAAS